MCPLHSFDNNDSKVTNRLNQRSFYRDEVEQISITFIDENRDNREITAEIFLPDADGDLNITETGLPFIVFGHGWLTPYTAYQTLWETLVPTGWIMAFPTTEGGLFPSHEDFALDLAFLSFALPLASTDPQSPLFDLVDSLSIVMGHSMGGGCSILAASYENDYSSVVTLAAAATTNPSAIDAAEEVEIPSLTFAGTSDNVTPPQSNQIPLYNHLASIYKGYISLNDVTHFNIYSNDIVFNLLEPWLNYFLTQDPDFIDDFEDLLALYEADEMLTYMIEGNITQPIVYTPVFSPESGYYQQAVELEITTETEEAEIYYTLDGSEPTQESLPYTEPVLLDFTVTVKARAFKQDWLPSEIAEAFYEIEIIDAEDDLLAPLITSLGSAYPNPFNPSTTISFELTAKDAKDAKIEIYNLKGQKVKTILVPESQNHRVSKSAKADKSQSHPLSVVWNGDDESGKPVSSGVYYYKLNVNGKTEAVKKCLLLK